MFCISSLGELLRSYQAQAGTCLCMGHRLLTGGSVGRAQQVEWRREQKLRVLRLCSIERSLTRTYTKWVCHFKENKTHTWVKSLSLKLFLHRHYHKQEFLDPLHKGNVLGPPHRRVKSVRHSSYPQGRLGDEVRQLTESQDSGNLRCWHRRILAQTRPQVVQRPEENLDILIYKTS